MSRVRSSTLRLLACGDAAVLAEVEDLDRVLRLVAGIEAERESGGFAEVIDVVPAARTVLVRCRSGSDLRRLARALRDLPLPDQLPAPASEVEIAVVYDGADLDAVADLTGLSREEVVERHRQTRWRVAFTGFAPGFGYLVGGDGSLEVPRRSEPRARVPAGSVGLAGAFTGVYPRSSPGGWQLIGRTAQCLWDPDRDPPALLSPGTSVRFTEVQP